MKKRYNGFEMSRRTLQFIVLTLVFLLVSNPLASAAEKSSPLDVPSQVRALGVGAGAIVQLSDGSQKKGKITSIDESSFTLDGGKHRIQSVAYSNVTHVHSSLTTGKKVAFVAIGAGVVLLVVTLVQLGQGIKGL